jgi:hypothetical protein
MTSAQLKDVRTIALDAYLTRREAEGFRIETRSGIQAVISRRRPLFFILRWFRRTGAESRLVVSVDQQGIVSSVAAEPLRW